MFENTNKKQLYWLIDQYLSDKMNVWDFSNKYHACYDVELNLDCLSKKEDKLFDDLSLVAGRFSPYKEDHIAHPGFFYTEEELRKKVAEVKECLKNDWPTF
jgi:hypothetical protein